MPFRIYRTSPHPPLEEPFMPASGPSSRRKHVPTHMISGAKPRTLAGTAIAMSATLCLLAFCPAAFAHDPPPLPPGTPQQLVLPPSTHVPGPPRPHQLLRFTRMETEDDLGFSPTLYPDLAAYLALWTPSRSAFALNPTAAGGTESTGFAHGSRRFVATPLTNGSNFQFLNTDLNEDTESSVVSVRLPTTGVENAFAAWMQWRNPTSGGFHVAVSHWSLQSGSLVTQVLGDNPGDPTRIGDPMLGVNPFNAGFNPRTVYCITTSYNLATPPTNHQFEDTGITLWQYSAIGNSSRVESRIERIHTEH